MIAQIINELIAGLDQRQRDVMLGRFGLKGEKQTLAAIGKKYHLTRERVRQIEGVALSLIGKTSGKSTDKVVETAINILKKFGGVRKEEDLINDLRAALKDNKINRWQLRFIFEVVDAIKFHRNDKYFYDFWRLNDESFEKSRNFINKLAKFISDKKEEVITHKKFDELFTSVVKSHNLNDATAFNYVSISKKFKISPFGEFGLSHWDEINPKTIGAKTYLILKRHRKPLHFTEIAKRINAVKFDNRSALPQTVHNELIKDSRFVLVGRGMYGLSEFGLRPGTAKEVIARILKNKGPLPKEEVVNLTLQERFLQPNTILLNLQNKKHFKKLENGRYHIV